MNWFRRHLNWTLVLAYLLWFVPNAGESVVAQRFALVALIFLTVVSGWVIKQKGRSLWWILLMPFFSPLWLKNKRSYRELTETEHLKGGLIRKARTGTGRFVQIIGWVVWLGCGLYIEIYQIGVIYDAFGFWLAALAFMLFPIVYAVAPFIDWFITRIFPLGIFILWLVSLVGMVMVYAGSRIRGEE